MKSKKITSDLLIKYTMKHEKIQIVTFLKQGQMPDATACLSRLQLLLCLALLWTKDGDNERDSEVVR